MISIVIVDNNKTISLEKTINELLNNKIKGKYEIVILSSNNLAEKSLKKIDKKMKLASILNLTLSKANTKLSKDSKLN